MCTGLEYGAIELVRVKLPRRVHVGVSLCVGLEESYNLKTLYFAVDLDNFQTVYL